MDVIEGVRVAIKEMMLPELDRIREENKKIKATLVMINKRLDDVNLHLADQSRRIDATRESWVHALMRLTSGLIPCPKNSISVWIVSTR